jgi:hypothetical protein
MTWEPACEEPGWYQSKGVGSIRSSNSYRPGGWWFLPVWLPDARDNDVGPFKTLQAAKDAAEKMAAERVAS